MFYRIFGFIYILTGSLAITEVLPVNEGLSNEKMMAIIFILSGTILMKDK